MSLMVTLSLFNILAIGMMPAYSKAKAQEKDGQTQGAIQMEITSDSVREIFKGLRAAMKLRLAMG
jgi:hypothetical protein